MSNSGFEQYLHSFREESAGDFYEDESKEKPNVITEISDWMEQALRTASFIKTLLDWDRMRKCSSRYHSHMEQIFVAEAELRYQVEKFSSTRNLVKLLIFAEMEEITN